MHRRQMERCLNQVLREPWSSDTTFVSYRRRLEDEASVDLKYMIHNPDKEGERKQLLRERPERRIVVQAKPLRSIVKYDLFKCHPMCSIARGEAVRYDSTDLQQYRYSHWSDIDGGLVVTRLPVDTFVQSQFAAELRRQGFRAFTAQEVSDASTPVINDREATPDCPQPLESTQLTFLTCDELERQLDTGHRTLPLDIYLAGHTIDCPPFWSGIGLLIQQLRGGL